MQERFDFEFFMTFLLPPIIFEAGFNLQAAPLPTLPPSLPPSLPCLVPSSRPLSPRFCSTLFTVPCPGGLSLPLLQCSQFSHTSLPRLHHIYRKVKADSSACHSLRFLAAAPALPEATNLVAGRMR